MATSPGPRSRAASWSTGSTGWDLITPVCTGGDRPLVGYYQPYATSHEALDRDQDFQDEVRNVALTLMDAVTAKREGRLIAAGANLKDPRPK